MGHVTDDSLTNLDLAEELLGLSFFLSRNGGVRSLKLFKIKGRKMYIQN